MAIGNDSGLFEIGLARGRCRRPHDTVLITELPGLDIDIEGTDDDRLGGGLLDRPVLACAEGL